MADYRDLRKGDASLERWRADAEQRATAAVADRLREQRGGLADQRAQMMGELERLRGELEQEREGHLEAVGIALGETREQIIADFERRVAESEQRLMVKFIEHFMRSGLAVKTLAVRGTYDNRERYSVLDGVAREREGAASFQRSRCRHR